MRKIQSRDILISYIPLAGFEPAPPRVASERSIHLSYRGSMKCKGRSSGLLLCIEGFGDDHCGSQQNPFIGQFRKQIIPNIKTEFGPNVLWDGNLVGGGNFQHWIISSYVC